MRHGVQEAEHKEGVVIVIRAVQGMVDHIQEGSGKEERSVILWHKCIFSLSPDDISCLCFSQVWALRPLVCGDRNMCLVQNQVLGTHPYE